MAPKPFAPLLMDWGELDLLAGLVDAAIASLPDPHTTPHEDTHLDWAWRRRWQELNSLRTALREAQSGLVVPPDG